MTIADKAMPVTGANRGNGQTLVAEAPSSGADRVDAGTRRPSAHPDGRVTLLTPDLTISSGHHLNHLIPAGEFGGTPRSWWW